MTVSWGAHQLRLSLFSTSPYSATDTDWKKLTGSSEDADNRQALPAGGRRFSGPHEKGELIIAAAATRFDIVYSAAQRDIDAEFIIPVVGPWEGALEHFVKITEPWLEQLAPPPTRMAFGSIFLFPAKNIEECYSILKSLLRSVSVDVEKMRELVFRVNWPQPSKVIKDHTLNRITNWSSLRLVQQVLQIDAAGGNQMTSPAPSIYAVRLEMDHSTDEASIRPFDPKERLSIYKELVALACENASKGEKP
jgi:hypothetical protein